MQRTVWQIDKAGSLDRLKKVTQELPDPAPGEIQIEIKAVGLNFADLFACQDLYSATPAGAFVPGLEYAGLVHAAGAGCNLKSGTRIMGLTRFGAYASHLNIKEIYTRRLPEKWSYADGAAYLAQGLTAWYALVELGNLQAGQTVLVHSAAGGVGLHSLKILQAKGAHAIATIGSPTKHNFLLERGLDSQAIIIRRAKKFKSDLKQALDFINIKHNIIQQSTLTDAEPGFDIILDAVAGPYFQPAFERLNPMGRYVIFGAATFMHHSSRPNYLKLAWQYLRRPRLDPIEMISDNRAVLAFNLIWLWDHMDVLDNMLDAMADCGLEEHAPHVGHRFDFEDAPTALREFQKGLTRGKVVLEINR